MRYFWTGTIRSPLSGLLCLGLLLFAACGAGDDDLGYAVYVDINGTELAFEGRSIEVGTRVASSPGVVPGADRGLVGVSVGVCTRNHVKFLTGPVHIVVKGPAETLSDVSLQRVACRDSQEGGNTEANHLFLEDTGLLDTEFGLGTNVWAACGNGSLVPCPVDTF